MIIKLYNICSCLNLYTTDEEIVTGCVNDAVITYKAICPDCGSITYGYEISDRDGELLTFDGGFETRDIAEEKARKADRI